MPSPRYWREIPARYRLEGGRCSGCGKVVYPIRRVCPSCRKGDMEPVALSRRGRVVTSTVIHVAPPAFHMAAPYSMAVVETPEGARLMVQVADCESDEVVPGAEVSLEFRRIQREGKSGILCYGHKAVPVRSGSA
ncbi:MAG TPA: Zn-ribbon domain-containing OB-fold protein [Gemmatimonadales bacterium]